MSLLLTAILVLTSEKENVYAIVSNTSLSGKIISGLSLTSSVVTPTTTSVPFQVVDLRSVKKYEIPISTWKNYSFYGTTSNEAYDATQNIYFNQGYQWGANQSRLTLTKMFRVNPGTKITFVMVKEGEKPDKSAAFFEQFAYDSSKSYYVGKCVSPGDWFKATDAAGLTLQSTANFASLTVRYDNNDYAVGAGTDTKVTVSTTAGNGIKPTPTNKTLDLSYYDTTYILTAPFTYKFVINGKTTTISRMGLADIQSTVKNISGYSDVETWTITNSTGTYTMSSNTLLDALDGTYRKVLFDDCTITGTGKYTVTYNGNGGTADPSSADVLYKNSMPAITVPTRAYKVTFDMNNGTGATRTGTVSYTFGGYYWTGTVSTGCNPTTVTALVYDSSGTLQSGYDKLWTPKNVTLDAKWTSKSVTLPTISRTGYTFGGWYKDSACTQYVGAGGDTYTPTVDVTLYAKWTANSYTLTFDANGGTLKNPGGNLYNGTNTDSVPVTYDKGSYAFMSGDIPTRTGYTFKGWYTATSGGTQVYDSSGNCTNEGTYWSSNKWVYTGNVTLYAQWVPNTDTKYTVNHYQMNVSGNGYALKETDNLTGTTDTDVTPAVKTYTGFTSPETQTVTIAADGSTVVNYYYTRNQYTVSLSKGTGISSVTGAGTYYYGASVTIDATVLTGYSWSKWSGTHSTTTKNYTFTMPASNVTDTANAAINTYTLTLDGNGATSTNHTTSVNATYGASLPNITVPKRVYTVTLTDEFNPTSYLTSTYTFNGYKYGNTTWYGSNGAGTKTMDMTSSLTLTADWTSISVTLPTPVKAGYGFKGWTDGTNTYNAGSKYTPTKNVTLTATWEVNETSITVKDVDIYIFNGGTEGILGTWTDTGLIGEDYTPANSKTYSGYEFVAGTTITVQISDNVAYRFYNPKLTINSVAYNTEGKEFFKKNEYGILEMVVTGYANKIEITFPDEFLGTKWTNLITNKTVDLTTSTTTNLGISSPVLKGSLKYVFKIPDTIFENPNINIKLKALRGNPADFFLTWKESSSLDIEVETETEINVPIAIQNINILSLIMSAIRG